MSLPDIIKFVKSANNRCNFCFKIVVQVAVFFNGVSKGQCVQILCPALCTFPTRVFTSFLNVLAFNTRITANVVSKLWCKLPCFCNGVSKWQCVQIFVPCNVALFLQDGSQVFERVYFLQPYYDKLCFKIVAQVAVFLQLRFKRKVRANFCALQRCTFPTRGLASF